MREQIALLVLLASCATAYPQDASGPYKPPPSFAQNLQGDKPLIEALTALYGSGDKAAVRTKIEHLAIAGDENAQIVMANAYTPPECTYLSFRTAPTDCANDPKPANALGVTPSFDSAIHWLKLASDQGNGEATEMLAQLTERAIRSSALSTTTITEVARLHALARSQGFDLQDVEYSCYTLEQSPNTEQLTLESNPPSEGTLSSDQLAQLQAAGTLGALRWRLTSIQPNMTVALKHPEGPKVHIRIIVSASMTREIKVPLPQRTDVIYLQQGGRVATIPPTYPTISRSLAFRPPNQGERGGAFFQGIDGKYTAICSATKP